MSLPIGSKVSPRRKVDLSKFCTMKVGGFADYFAEPHTEDELSELLHFAAEEKLRVFILGKGSNVVFTDAGFRGLVITLIHFGDQDIRISVETHEVTASAGVHLYRLALACRDAGLSGVEFLSGIPGTVGGAIMMNAGFSRFPGQNNEIADLVKEITVLDEAGRKRKLSREDIVFRYRHSSLQGMIVLDATLRLWRRPQEMIEEEMRGNLDYRNREQDLKHPSSGSIFKNPPKPHPSAGRLIDQLGLKGTRVGGMLVSPKHGNYFINAGQATCADLVELIAKIQRAVKDGYGIDLEPEVRIIN